MVRMKTKDRPRARIKDAFLKVTQARAKDGASKRVQARAKDAVSKLDRARAALTTPAQRDQYDLGCSLGLLLAHLKSFPYDLCFPGDQSLRDAFQGNSFVLMLC